MFSCGNGSLNKATGELHYQNNITKGQELIDLKEALDKDAIDQLEYDALKKRIINDEHITEFFQELNKMNDSYDDSESASI